MEAEFWLDRWNRQQIGFHQQSTNAHLEAEWSGLAIPAGGKVLVPLCGKSLDMLWLAAQGYQVVGIELSPIAVRAFFAENGLSPSVRREGAFEIYCSGQIEIRCGDFFDLSARDLADVCATYDRASLVALPQEMRERYAIQLSGLLPEGAQVMLITFDYPQEQMSGPPFSVSVDEVHRLYDQDFDVRLLSSEEILSRNERFMNAGLSQMQEHIFLMQRRIVRP